MTERRLFIRIELTDTARARAEAAGLDVNAAASQSLDDRVQVGDRLSFGANPADDFVVLRRRYLIGNGPAILVLVLDHPARN